MTDGRPTARRRLKDIDHTHPVDDRAAGQLFARGPTVIADGGRRDTDTEGEPAEEQRLRDVDHEGDGESANPVWTRGAGERPADEPVTDEE